ncbi:hypothetical protein [Lysobacter gummosus]|uniref:hypothetical protein n=1 Tax=Lysobacter gummosus TaxID=262324 RepID=UPI003634DE83
MAISFAGARSARCGEPAPSRLCRRLTRRTGARFRDCAHRGAVAIACANLIAAALQQGAARLWSDRSGDENCRRRPDRQWLSRSADR